MIALLLRLYPAAWRMRYADEFAAVLEQRPLGPFDVADVLLSALDAHLNLRGLGAASQSQRGFAMSLRIGGYAAILAGILWFIALGANAVNNGGDGAPWIFLVIVIATILTLIALTGLSAFQARRYPALTWAAFAVPAVSAVVALIGFAAMAATGDSDRAEIAGVPAWGIMSIGLMGLFTGSGLFALVTWRVRTLSRAAAVVLGLGAISMFPVISGVGSGWLPTPLGFLVVIVPVAFSGGWVWLGLSALRAGRPVTSSLEGASL
ncbi:MAG: hypothetical protein ABIU97_09675 [Dehalococcoidia bacterium]